MNGDLTYDTLRGANIGRLPQFKNKHGGLAHSKPDGSDWSPAQWFQAMIGEVGEYARVRLDYEHGNTTNTEMRIESAKELADVATYLDILARRSLDEVEEVSEDDPARTLMWLMAELGEYANARKKLDRGDLTSYEFAVVINKTLKQARTALDALASFSTNPMTIQVTHADLNGVNLGQAIIKKFNEVTERVGSTVVIDESGADWHFTT